jgi:hypothetical protein
LNKEQSSFIFSTAALTGEEKREKDHLTLREKLESKGYRIVDEFQCKGFNTNSYLSFFGGMNKGRTNADFLIRLKDSQYVFIRRTSRNIRLHQGVRGTR